MTRTWRTRFRLLPLLALFVLPLAVGAQETRDVPPLSLGDVTQLLSAGVTPVRLKSVITERGASFQLTDAIEKQLRELGATDELLLQIAKSFRASAAPKKPPEPEAKKLPPPKAEPLSVPAPQSPADAGRALLLAAADAAGATRTRVETLIASGLGRIVLPNGEVDAEFTQYVAFPNHVRGEIKFPFGALLYGYDGLRPWGFISGGAGVTEMPMAANSEIQRDILLIGGIGLYQYLSGERLNVTRAGEEDVGGRRLMAADWSGPSGRVRLYFDPQTRLMVGARYRATYPQESYESLELWSDFREVHGVKLPFRGVSYRDGVKYVDQLVLDLRINVPIAPAIFSRPPLFPR